MGGGIVCWFLFLAVYSHVYMIVDLAPEMLGMVRNVSIWGSIVSWFLFLSVYSHVYMIVDLAPEMLGMVRNISIWGA